MKRNNKKYIFFIITLFLAFFLFCPITEALDYNSICSEDGVKKAARIIGYVVQVLRWIVPFIIIVLGMVDFGKAVLSNDEKAVNKATGALIKRLIAGVIVFFIPTIIMAILNVIKVTNGIENETNSQFGACTKCIFDPNGSCPIS